MISALLLVLRILPVLQRTLILSVSGAASYWFGGKYNWVCQAVDYSTNPDAVKVSE